MAEATKVYTFDSNKPGDPKEQVLTGRAREAGNGPMLFQINGRRTASLRETVRALQEAGADTTTFPALLRDGLKAILFDSYNETPTTFQDWCAIEASDKQNEDYIAGSNVGLLPVVREGEEVPHVTVDLRDTVKISNAKKEMIFDITNVVARHGNMPMAIA